MLEPPNLDDQTIIDCLHTQYGLPDAGITFLPIGHDSSAWVYRVQAADETTYFLKVRKGAVNELGFMIPHFLSDQGVTNVVTPLPTLTQALRASVADFSLILYPFVQGRTGMEAGLAESQWIEYGATLRQIHATTLTPDLAQLVRRETFIPEWSDIVLELDAYIGARNELDPFQAELAAFWRVRRAEIRSLVSRANALGQQFQRISASFVLCHADVHTANVLLDTDQKVWIVDWDETTLAPKERDLMFVVGGIIDGLVGAREEELFFEGYGQTEIDPLGLAYYRHAWAVGDIGAYGQQVFFLPDVGAETKRSAVQGFKFLFKPGNIVALAKASNSLIV